MNRRSFLDNASRLVVGSSSLSALTNLQLIGSASANTYSQSNDYKALICLYLPGGMDSFNVLMPGDGHPERGRYDGNRGGIKIPLTVPTGDDTPTALELTNKDAGDLPYVVHPKLNAARDAYNIDGANGTRNLAFLTNVGTLIEKIETNVVPSLTLGGSNVPASIGGHNTQIKQWQTLRLQGAASDGWLARLAELQSINTVFPLTTDGVTYSAHASAQDYSHISINAQNFMQSGRTPSSYEVSNSGPVRLRSYLEGLENVWTDNSAAHGCEDFARNILEQQFARSSYSSDGLSSDFNDAFTGSSPTFTSQSNSNINEMMGTLFKSMAAGRALGLERQTFFIRYGGWDHHSNVTDNLANNLEGLNQIIAAFTSFINDTSNSELNATLFTASDFGRTLQPNGSGTDHAWGGNQMIIGNDVNGGKVYGHFPSLALKNNPENHPSRDYDGRGRLVPTTSLDEYYAVLARWLGTYPALHPNNTPWTSELTTILPNLENFINPSQGPLNLTNQILSTYINDNNLDFL